MLRLRLKTESSRTSTVTLLLQVSFRKTVVTRTARRRRNFFQLKEGLLRKR